MLSRGLASRAPGDAARGADLDAQALAAARAMGMTVLEGRVLESEASEAAPARSGSDAGTFRREGEYWVIAYDGEAIRMKHSKGLAYLARLLERPGAELHALDLVGAGGNGRGVAAREDGLRPETGDGAGPIRDEAAKAAYRERVDELRADLAQAEEWNDAERVARARAELDALAAQLSGAVGLGGRDRSGASSSSERARISVTRAIRGALDRLGRQSPSLARHLEATVHTGTYSSYTPDPRAPITWER